MVALQQRGTRSKAPKIRIAIIALQQRGTKIGFPAALPHIHELAIGIAAYTCTCQRHCRIYMNLAAALPHIHELVSGIAAYTYTSSRVNVSSAATTAQVVALHSKVFFRKHGGRSSTQVVGLGNRSGSDDISRLLVHVRMKSGRGLNADGGSLCIVFGVRVRLSCSCLATHCVMYIMR